MNGYVNETRTVGDGVIVQAYSILTTDLVAFAVYEPYTPHELGGSHGTSTKIGEDLLWVGAVPTRRPPAELLALPYGDERTAAVRAHYAKAKRFALAAIRRAFPELVGLQELEDVGRALVTVEEFRTAVQA